MNSQLRMNDVLPRAIPAKRFANVASLDELWTEERDRCRELGIPSQLEPSKSPPRTQNFPSLNPPEVNKLWEDHLIALLQAVKENLSSGQKEVIEPNNQSYINSERPLEDSVEDLLEWFRIQALQLRQSQEQYQQYSGSTQEQPIQIPEVLEVPGVPGLSPDQAQDISPLESILSTDVSGFLCLFIS
jgi:hypothetical protein